MKSKIILRHKLSMNKLNILCLASILIFLLIPKSILAQDIKLWINGNYIPTDVTPIIENERTLVPLRIISENLGLNVEWNGDSKQALISNPLDNLNYIFEIDKAEYAKGDTKISMDVAPKIVQGRTLVPIRVIAEAFGQKINWDSENKTVVIGEGYITPEKPQPAPVNPQPEIVKESKVVVVNESINQKFTADTTQGVIKGNRNSKIYHVPGGASYDKISVKNVVYFNSEAEAQKAGYRRAKK